MARLRFPRSRAFVWAVGTTLFLLLLRLDLARRVGFGDAEALYACYGMHPQPAYLDHPGLVGVLSRFIGGGAAPSPSGTHLFTAIAAAVLPWLGVVAARAAGAAFEPSLRVFFALALAPEMVIGLFALTPDVPLAFFWILALGLAAWALRSPAKSRTALGGTVLAGLAAGLAIESKATGVLLLAALAAAFAAPPARAHAKTLAPWLGLGVALVVAAPLAIWEQSRGFPMLAHRFVETQSRSGPSLRNLGALLGGQLLYVTPPFLIGAYRVFRSLVGRATDPVDRLLVLAAVVPGVPLALLCAWSRVAEPHWLAPAYLSLALGAARAPSVGTRVARSAVGLGFGAAALAWVWVATPVAPETLGRLYVPRYDLANDLYAWQGALRVVRDEVERAREDQQSVAVVAPHWVLCAQLHAGLGVDVPVGCASPGGDDFASWFPRGTWANVATVLYVTDDRFPAPQGELLPDRAVTTSRRFLAYRGGRLVRTIRIMRLDRKAFASLGGDRGLLLESGQTQELGVAVGTRVRRGQ